MFRLMLQKITHKKWMILCLLIGNILLIAVAICHPMYQSASARRMLRDEFEIYIEENEIYPGLVSFSATSEKKDGRNLVERFYAYLDRCYNRLQIPLHESVDHYAVVKSKIELQMKREDTNDLKISVGMINDFENHVSLIAGDMYTDKVDDNGCIEAVMNQSTMVEQKLLIGDVITFHNLKGADGKPIQVKIVGTVQADTTNSNFWAFDLETYSSEVFIPESTFRKIFMEEEEEKFTIRCYWYRLFDYEKILPQDVDRILNAMDEIQTTENYSTFMRDCYFPEILKSYNMKAKTNQATFNILQVPLLLLLCAFLFMISGQMLTMEQNEISLMKSRGAKRIHIILLYFLQSSFLAAISFLIALPLGKVVCKLLGSAVAFLEFSNTKDLVIEYDKNVFLFALASILLSVIMTVLPVIKYSGVSIVNLKRSRSRSKKAFWQKAFLDIICLGVSLYGYYSFRKSKNLIMENVLSGKSLDPLLYLCSSLFILGAGFLFLRLQPIIIKILYKILKRGLGAVGFSSYLSAIRSGAKQQFIMLFMILTVALGIFHATVARTILNNATENVDYLTGADFILQESWKNNAATLTVDPTAVLQYTEPDFGKYTQIGGVKKVAQVYNSTASTKIEKDDKEVTLMGIVPRDFASVTTVNQDLLYCSYIDYLNVLASDVNGVLLSENFMIKHNVHIGDSINIKSSNKKTIKAKVSGFVNYWPSYSPSTYVLNSDGTVSKKENYLIIANLSLIQSSCGALPYEVWMRLDGDSQVVYDWVQESGTKVSYYTDLSKEEEAIIRDNLFQGTNGILTLSFIIILILCAVGYLIYWIMSIRSRELLFGVLRAMGMGKGQIIRMLVNEQIFCGISSILAGALIGCVGAYLYVPMIQYAYASANQALPLKLVANSSDLSKLFAVIGFVLILCLIVLARIVAKMNITKALKLGEE